MCVFRFPLTEIVSLFLAADLARTAVRLFHAGPTVLNSLPDGLRNLDSFDGFKSWKQFFSAVTSVTSALELF